MEETRKLVEVVDNPKNQALVLTHYEVCCRIGETLSSKNRNATIDQNGAILIGTRAYSFLNHREMKILKFLRKQLKPCLIAY